MPSRHQQNGRFSAGNRPEIDSSGRGRPLDPIRVCGIDFWDLFRPPPTRVCLNNHQNDFSVKNSEKIVFFSKKKMCHFSAYFWTTAICGVLPIEISTPKILSQNFLLQEMTYRGSFPYFMACQYDWYFLLWRCAKIFVEKYQKGTLELSFKFPFSTADGLKFFWICRNFEI